MASSTVAAVPSLEGAGSLASGADHDNENDYIKTSSQSYVSRQATMHGATQIELKGRSVIRSHCQLDGSKAPIRFGRYCFLKEYTSLSPAERTDASSSTQQQQQKCVPMLIGSHVEIGRNCRIEAAAVGSYCRIGNDCRIGKRAIIKDCCVIEDGALVGDDTIIPPFTRISRGTGGTEGDGGGNGEYRWSLPQCGIFSLPPSTATIMQERTTRMYQEFVSSSQSNRS